MKKVYFGCFNEKFGGNGSILSLHLKSESIAGYKSEGGFFEEKFINILRKFYTEGNNKLPESKRHRKPKENVEQDQEIIIKDQTI